MINSYGLVLRDIKETDLQQLRHWRNDKAIRLNMIHQDIISESEHYKWYQSLNNKDNERHYLVEYKNIPVGYANYKLDKDLTSGETGLYIGEHKYRGTVLSFCLGLALLDYLFEHYTLTSLYARVLNANEAAIRFNQRLGYRVLTTDDDLTHMKLTSQWYQTAKTDIKKIIRF